MKWLVDLRWWSNVKLCLMRFIIARPRTHANQLLGVTQANVSRALFVNPCRRDFVLGTKLTKFSKDSNTNKQDKKLWNDELWSCFTFNESDPSVILSFFATRVQKKIDCSSADSFRAHFITVWKNVTLYHVCQEARASLKEDDFERGNQKRRREEWRKQ